MTEIVIKQMDLPSFIQALYNLKGINILECRQRIACLLNYPFFDIIEPVIKLRVFSEILTFFSSMRFFVPVYRVDFFWEVVLQSVTLV